MKSPTDTEEDDLNPTDDLNEEIHPADDDDEMDQPVDRCAWYNTLLGILLALLAVIALVSVGLKDAITEAHASGEAAKLRCTIITPLSDGGPSTGATNGLERRALSSPAKVVRPPPDGYCAEVYASPLGHATPDCNAAPSARPGGVRVGESSSKWWQRWGATVDEAVEYLMRALHEKEKERLLRGFGWSTWQSLPGHYIGNTLGVPRLGVPSINMQDAGSGFRTVSPSMVRTVTQWPSMMATSATWDAALTYELAAAIGREFRQKGANVVLGPGVNVQRVALNGRNAEYLSGEEPTLGAVLADAYVRGVQAEGVAAVVKHYVLNSQETDRTSSSSVVDDRTLWEIYYPPFEAAVRAGAASVMCSYNRVAGTHACGNERTLTRDLRERMGFSGWVMSDWWAAHAIEDTASGLDQIMPGNDDFLEHAGYAGLEAEMTGARATGGAAEPDAKKAASRIDTMARRVLRGMIGSGAWDRLTCTVGCDCLQFTERVNATTAASAALARRSAAASAVLLKNERGVLPLEKGATVGLLGSGCSSVREIDAATADWRDGNYYGIGGSGRVIANHAPSLQQALRASGVRLVVSPTDGLAAALAVAADQSVNVLVACAGGTTTESKDRPTLRLDQHDWIHALTAGLAALPAAPPLAVVALAPGAFVADWGANVSAALAFFLAGEQTGVAAADVLLGAVSPSAKLPVTLPINEGDMVAPCVGGTPTCKYGEGLAVGWRALHGQRVAFPFGHGLSYTTFDFSWLSPPHARLSAADLFSSLKPTDLGTDTAPPDNALAATTHGASPSAAFTVRVRNVGNASGSEVVQLYVEFPQEAGEPPRVLRAFRKTKLLAPGEATDVTLSLSMRDLAVWAPAGGERGDGGWAPISGRFGVVVGASSRDERLRGSVSTSFAAPSR